jgi:hypothetical protein
MRLRTSITIHQVLGSRVCEEGSNISEYSIQVIIRLQRSIRMCSCLSMSR